jgi:hypothetical protein
MVREWIFVEAALVWLQRAYELPRFVAENHLREAWESGNVRMRESVTRIIEKPSGEFRVEYIPSIFGPLGIRRDPKLGFEELRWQIEKQLGKPKHEVSQPNTVAGPTEAISREADAERGGLISEPPAGVQTNRQVHAEEACQLWIRTLKEQANIRPATREMMDMREELSQTGIIRSGMGPREEHVLVLKRLNKTDNDYGYGRETYRTKVYPPTK